MISYLNGKILLKRDKFIILEVNNIGYKVFLSRQTLSRLDRGSSMDSPSGLKLPENTGGINGSTQLTTRLFCFHNVKEAASDLYGFLTYDELEFFEILNDIRGVGPKAALEISSLGALEKIKDRILAQDEKIFEGIPGIGSKKAMPIILELTGKIKLLSGQKAKSSADPAEDALIQLGFSRQQAKEALNNVPSNIKNMEERIKVALKNLGRG